MEIELRRITELAVHVKLASEAVLAAAEGLAELRPRAGTSEADVWRCAMDELLTLNVELGFMERILRTATCGEVALPRAARNGRSLTP